MARDNGCHARHVVYNRYFPNRVEGISFPPGEGMTKQEFKDECDINVIMARYVETGIAPQAYGVATYGDFSEVPDYMDAQEILIRARAQFEALPAKTRDRFANDPKLFLDWVHRPENYDEAADLGLLTDEGVKKVAEKRKPPPPPAPKPVEPSAPK